MMKIKSLEESLEYLTTDRLTSVSTEELIETKPLDFPKLHGKVDT